MKIKFFPIQNTRKRSAEEKVAGAIAILLANSYLVLGLLFFAVMGLARLSTEPSLLAQPFFLKVFIISALYIFSLYLLGTLPGKNVKRRSLSWIYSITFHAGLLAYLGVIEEFGTTVLIIGMMEVVALSLSVIGFLLLIYGVRKSSQKVAQVTTK